MDSQDRTPRTGLPGQHSQDRTPRTELPGQDSMDRIPRTGLPGQDSQDRTATATPATPTTTTTTTTTTSGGGARHLSRSTLLLGAAGPRTSAACRAFLDALAAEFDDAAQALCHEPNDSQFDSWWSVARRLRRLPPSPRGLLPRALARGFRACSGPQKRLGGLAAMSRRSRGCSWSLTRNTRQESAVPPRSRGVDGGMEGERYEGADGVGGGERGGGNGG